MSRSSRFNCHSCGEPHDELQIELESLEEELRSIRQALRGAREELEYLGHTCFVASAKRSHFHRPTCKWASYIPRTGRNLIEFWSHREAEEAGYKPCKTCRA
jgi:methylphosphotriester-DNA--protein-cysteine methyltransferase